MEKDNIKAALYFSEQLAHEIKQTKAKPPTKMNLIAHLDHWQNTIETIKSLLK